MTADTKTVTAFELQDLGVDSSSYFQGVGTAFTDWDEVFLGVGDTAREAADDARSEFYSLVEEEFPDFIAADIDAEIEKADDTVSAHADCTCDCDNEDCEEGEPGFCECHDECELAHRVALFVRYQEEEGDPFVVVDDGPVDVTPEQWEFLRTYKIEEVPESAPTGSSTLSDPEA